MSAKVPRLTVSCGECGKPFLVTQSRLDQGRGKYCSKTCGNRSTSRKHGHSWHEGQSPTYVSWSSMLQRCNNPKATKYPRYGAVGIKVCAEWHDYTRFLADMGERPEGHTIDRVNGELGYFKENCRWATPFEQQSHLRSQVYVNYLGQRFYMAQLARHLGLRSRTLEYRIRRWPESRWNEPVAATGLGSKARQGI